MAQRDTSANSRRRLRTCLIAALQLHGSGICITVRAGRSHATFPFLLNFFRLSARFVGNDVYFINISAEEFSQAAASWEGTAVGQHVVTSARDLKLWWAAAVATSCLPINDGNAEDVDAVVPTMDDLRLQ